MERSGHCGARIPHHDDHPADLQHRQWPGLRIHVVHFAASSSRPVSGSELVRLCADASVSGSIHLYRKRDMRSIWILLLAAHACLAGTDLLVQGAIDEELQPLLAALQGRKQIHVGAWTYWAGKIGDTQVVVSRTEVGPINA